MNASAPPQNTGTFAELTVAPAFLQILAKKNISSPTPIQHQAIPTALAGKDIIGIAQTGTGKTWAFGIPLLQRLAQGKGRALIVVPTRELAEQVDEALRIFTPALGIRTAVFIGGASMDRQRQMLRMNPRVLIATPGRLNDHLEQKTVTLKEVSILVLDEADQMLDMGFLPQIERILRHVPKERQTMLFSATMPQTILSLASKHMSLPLRIEVAPQGTAAKNVEQELFVVRKEEKIRLLRKILDENPATVLIFSRTKHGAKKMTKAIKTMGHSAAEIHANRSLNQRREALQGFKTGKYRILIATDIAARGIDVTGIGLVVNFDLPDDPSQYVHRIGRTARAGLAGRAISFATPDQASDIKQIERLIRVPIKRTPLPAELPQVEMPPPSRDDDSSRHGRFNDRPGRSFGGRGQRGARSGGGFRSAGRKGLRNFPEPSAGGSRPPSDFDSWKPFGSTGAHRK